MKNKLLIGILGFLSMLCVVPVYAQEGWRTSPQTGAFVLVGEEQSTDMGTPVSQMSHRVAPVQGGLYGTDGYYLYLIDKTNGSSTRIGLHGAEPNFIGALSFSSNGTLYGMNAGYSPYLYTIDTGNGAGTVVGAINLTFVFEGGLAFDGTGVLYGVNDSNADNAKAFTVDTNTGNAKIIGPSPGESRDLNGLTFDGQTFYAIDRVSNSFGTLNPTTGAYSHIAVLPQTVGNMGGIAADPTTKEIYAVFQDGTMVVIDRNGTTHPIGLTPAVYDIAFAPNPTPTSTVAVSFASLGLWVYKPDSATWTQLSSVNPENMIYSGSTLYVDFGASHGLYKWDGTAWSQLTSGNPENMVTSGSALYVNFGASYGLWKWDGSSWSQLTGSNPDKMAVPN